MFLASTSQSLEVLLSGAITTNQLSWMADYADTDTTTFAAATLSSANGATNNTTAVTLIGAPGSGKTRQVMHLIVFNADTVAATVTVRLNDATTFRQLVKVTLQTSESLTYETQSGWRVIDASGNTKVTAAAIYSADNSTLQLVSNTFSVKTNGVANSNLAQMATLTLKGNNTAGTANPSDLTAPQVATMLGMTSMLPCGRLTTMASGSTIWTADSTAQTSVFYDFFNGNTVPIYDGTAMVQTPFTRLTLALNTSDNLSTKIYDVFIFLNSGTVTIGTGPAWSSNTSRGTGAGTTELQQTNGLWVNKNTITLKNNGSSFSSIAVSKATYVGSIYCTANGQTGMAFRPTAASGGTNNFLGIYNAYNRVWIESRCTDSATYTYTTNGFRAANASNSNRVTWLDGLQQSFVLSHYLTYVQVTSANAFVGVGLDSTSSAFGETAVSNASTYCPMNVTDNILPQIGLHFVQALENGGGAATCSWTPSLGSLMIGLDM